jgi:hypothetical protein
MTQKQITNAEKTKVTSLAVSQDRESRIMNAMVNTTVILTSTIMGAFSQIMVGTTSAMASGMAEAFGGKEAGVKAKQEVEQKLPEVDEKMKEMVSELKKEMYTKMQQNKQELMPFLSDPAFDVGPEIIEKYDFKLPKLTQELDDQTLAQYSQLILSEDLQLAEMVKQLTSWLQSLPTPQKLTQDS